MKKENKHISTMWLTFCVYGRIPLILFLRLPSFIILFNSDVLWNGLNTTYITMFSILILLYLTIFIAQTIKPTLLSYNLLISSLIVETIYVPLNVAYFGNIESNNLFWMIILIAIISLIWLLPNIIYLKKRKHLFIRTEEKKQSSKSKNDNHKCIYCKNCGGKLDNLNKCTNCGKKYLYIPKIKINIKSIIISTMLLLLLSLNIYQYYELNKIKEELENVETKITGLHNLKNDLEDRINELYFDIILDRIP